MQRALPRGGALCFGGMDMLLTVVAYPSLTSGRAKNMFVAALGWASLAEATDLPCARALEEKTKNYGRI